MLEPHTMFEYDDGYVGVFFDSVGEDGGQESAALVMRRMPRSIYERLNNSPALITRLQIQALLAEKLSV